MTARFVDAIGDSLESAQTQITEARADIASAQASLEALRAQLATLEPAAPLRLACFSCGHVFPGPDLLEMHAYVVHDGPAPQNWDTQSGTLRPEQFKHIPRLDDLAHGGLLAGSGSKVTAKDPAAHSRIPTSWTGEGIDGDTNEGQ